MNVEVYENFIVRLINILTDIEDTSVLFLSFFLFSLLIENLQEESFTFRLELRTHKSCILCKMNDAIMQWKGNLDVCHNLRKRRIKINFFWYLNRKKVKNSYLFRICVMSELFVHFLYVLFKIIILPRIN